MSFWSTYKPHYRYLAKLGLPLVLGQLGLIVAGLADTLMVGGYGSRELAAASFVNGVYVLGIVVLTGFSYGLTPLVGSLFGRGNREGIGELLKNGLMANLIMGLVVSLLMWILYFFLDKLGQPSQLLTLMRDYYSVMLVSIIFLALFNGFKQFADGIGDTPAGMWIMLAGNGLNIVLNYLFIFGKFGFPEWGLWGAGLATAISRVLMGLAFLWLFLGTRRYAFYRTTFKMSVMRVSLMKKITFTGLPVAVQMGLETVSFSFAAMMMGWLGVTALAAHQILNTVGTICFMIYYGIGAAVSIRVSHFYGQHDLKEARRTASAGFHLIVVAFLFSGSLIFACRNYFSGWFTADTEVAATIATMLPIFFLYQLGDGLQANFANALRGTCDVKPVMYIAVFAYLVVNIPVGYFFGFVLDWGARGVWMGFPFGLTTAGILYFVRFRKQTGK